VAASKLQVTGINHVVLHVTDLRRSKSFYMDVLAFEDRLETLPGTARERARERERTDLSA
jgi:catechol-2,3-dioxygenase